MKINTKSKLLSSLLVLALCVTMFAGATYAWFTDEVTSSGNIIKSGTLKVGMEWADGKVDPAGATWTDASTGPIFTYDKWEPGYTEVRHIKITNAGTLALKYQLSIEANGAVSELADVIDVYFIDPAAAVANRGDLASANKIGTLTQVLAGLPASTAAVLETQGASDVVTIALKMQESAGNDYQNKSIGTDFSVKLFATQKDYEADSFGPEYDANLEYPVASAEELVAAIEAGKYPVLSANVPLTEALAIDAGTNTVVHLNGHTLSFESTEAKASAAIQNKGTLTLTGGIVTYKGIGDNSFGYGTNTINNSGKLVIDGATIINTTDSGSSVAIDNTAGAELIVNGGTITSVKNAIRLCPFSNAAINCTINGGTITGARAIQIQLPSSNSASAPEINLTVNGGTLSSNLTDGLSIYSYSAGQSFDNVNVALNGGTFNGDVCFGGGNKATRENVTITGGTFNNEVGRWVTADDFVSFKATTADSLADALGAGYAFVLADINLADAQITIPAGTSATMNLNGHDVSGAYTAADHYAMFKVPNGAALTVNGTGEVTATTEATDNNRSLALFHNSGKLTLNGGTYNLTDNSTGKTWIIATIVDNRTSSASCETVLTINGGDYSVSGNAINLFRNYPQQGGTATIKFNDGTFNANPGKETTYIWNQEAGSYLGELYFNGGTYDSNVVYEDYNGQSDIHIAAGVTINGYSGNN